MNMKSLWLVCVAFVAFVALPGVASANVCDDINSLADAWNGIANEVHEGDLAEMTEEELKVLQEDVNAFDADTMELATAMLESGDDIQIALADKLIQSMAELDAAADAASAVAALDTIVEAMDTITDDCDVVEDDE